MSAFRPFPQDDDQDSIERDQLVMGAKAALVRLATAIAGSHDRDAACVRSCLQSLYANAAMFADLSALRRLAWPLRRDLCTVLLAFGEGDFDDRCMRSAFEDTGDDTCWLAFDAPTPDDRLAEALTYAKPGPLTSPRTSTEQRVAHFLISLFTGAPINLQASLQGLDATRATLLGHLATSYANGRFNPTDFGLVRTYFWLESPN
ncbi:MAG TPA: hypothetical protein VGD81_07260 [Opitutaceae bacterium]